MTQDNPATATNPRGSDYLRWTGDGVPLWRAVHDLAAAWRDLPFVQECLGQLPRNHRGPFGTITQRLQLIHASDSGTSHISAHPLHLTPILEISRGFPHLGPAPAGWTYWVRDAMLIDVAHSFTLAWLRSRMPGYPSFPAPQLARGTHLTTLQSTERQPWTDTELVQGFETSPPPPHMHQLLHADPAQARALTDATHNLVNELVKSTQWTALFEADRQLTDEVRAELDAARRTVAEQLTDSALNAHSNRILNRFNYRVTVLEDHLALLPAAAAAYATAFDRANRLLELAASDVLGQLVAHGEPRHEANPQTLDTRPGFTSLVSFTRANTDAHFADRLEVGQLLFLDHPLVPDGVRLTGATESYGYRGHVERWTASLLPGSASAWNSAKSL